MLSKPEVRALTDGKIIRKLFQQGKTVSNPRTPDLRLLSLPASSQEACYLICVSAKGRTIVLRNRLKRVMRHILRELAPEIRAGALFAIFPRYSLLRKSHEERVQSVQKILLQAKILRFKLSENSSANNC